MRQERHLTDVHKARLFDWLVGVHWLQIHYARRGIDAFMRGYDREDEDWLMGLDREVALSGYDEAKRVWDKY